MPEGGQPTIEREELVLLTKAAHPLFRSTWRWAEEAVEIPLRDIRHCPEAPLPAAVRQHLNLGPGPVVVRVTDGSEDG